MIITRFGFSLEEYPAPFLLMGGTLDNTIPWKEQYCCYRRMVSPEKHLYELVGGGHFSFSDMCSLDLDDIEFEDAPDPRTDGCSVDNVPYRDAHQTINHYSTAFFNSQLRGSTSSLEFLGELEDGLFETVNYYKDDDLPDWPEGGCAEP